MGDRFIIQWNNVTSFTTPVPAENRGTFQVQIFDAAGPALAQFLYLDVDWGNGTSGGLGATIGAVGAGATPRAFAQFSHNTATIQPGVVVSIVPAPGAIALLGLGGLVATRRRRA
jgi:hypothetical protein